MRTCATATTWRLNLAVLDFTVLALSAAALGRIRGRWGSPIVGPPLEATAVHGLDARCDDDHREVPLRVAASRAARAAASSAKMHACPWQSATTSRRAGPTAEKDAVPRSSRRLYDRQAALHKISNHVCKVASLAAEARLVESENITR